MAHIANQQLNTQQVIQQNKPIWSSYKALMETPDELDGSILQSPSILRNIMSFQRQITGGASSFETSKTRKFLYQDIAGTENPNIFTTEVGSAGGAGAPVTTTIKSPYGNDGRYTVPVVNHPVVANIKGEQVFAIITAVNTSTVNDYQVTLTPINGGSIDLSVGDIDWLYFSMVQYDKSCDSTIQAESVLFNAPNVIVGNIQEFETGLPICQNDLTHYDLETIPKRMEVYDQLSGQMIDTYCIVPAMAKIVHNRMMMSKVENLLFNQYDGIKDQGFDGLFATAKKRGMFNFKISSSSLPLFQASVEEVMTELFRKGIFKCKVYCDFVMMRNVNKLLALLPGNNSFGLPIFKGENKGLIEMASFTGLTRILGIPGLEMEFILIDGWENSGFGVVQKDFGIVIPEMNITDRAGNKKPMVAEVKLDSCTGLKQSAENGWNNDLWYDTTGLTAGKRVMNIFARYSSGYRFYGANYLSLFRGEQCNG